MKYTVKQARVGADLTMQEIAYKMGIHPQTYAKYEKHPKDMSISTAEKFAEIVGLNFEDIIFLATTSN